MVDLNNISNSVIIPVPVLPAPPPSTDNPIQDQINQILAAAKLPNGEYNLFDVMNVFMLADQLYNNTIEGVTGNMDTTGKLISQEADLQNIFKEGTTITPQDGDNLRAELQNQYQVVTALYDQGIIKKDTYDQICGPSGMIADMCKKLAPEVILPNGSFDFTKSPGAEFAGNIYAIWQAQKANGDNAPSPAAQQDMQDLNQDFATGQQSFSTVSTNLKSLFSYDQKTDQTWQTQGYNFASMLTHTMTTVNNNIQRSS